MSYSVWLQRKWAPAVRDRYRQGCGGQGKRGGTGAADKGGRWQRLKVGSCFVLVTARKESCCLVFVTTWGKSAMGSGASEAGRQQRRHRKRPGYNRGTGGDDKFLILLRRWRIAADQFFIEEEEGKGGGSLISVGISCCNMGVLATTAEEEVGEEEMWWPRRERQQQEEREEGSGTKQKRLTATWLQAATSETNDDGCQLAEEKGGFSDKNRGGSRGRRDVVAEEGATTAGREGRG
ncbi:hypothetical protein BHM03_00034583 [Ensete ventricosum]|nr:hypothetical protein BHM03_00034583 [Ensete ventricosum]